MYFFPYVVSFLITFFLIFFLKYFAYSLRLIDIPNQRKIHFQKTPVVGGIAICLNLVVGMIIFPNIFSFNTKILFSIIVFFAILGAIDDRFDINYLIKIVIQILIILLLSYFGVKIISLGSINENIIYLGIASIPFTILMFFGFVNAVNFIDGIDGLSSSYMIFSVIIYFLLSYLLTGYIIESYIIYFLISILVFLSFNLSLFNLPKIFIGDSGTFFCSAVIASIFIIYSQDPLNIIHPLLVPWCMNVLIYELLYNSIRRIVNKKNPFRPDRLHLHHKLLNYNLNHLQIVLTILFLQTIFTFIGFIIFINFENYFLLIIFTVMFFVYYFTVSNLEKILKSKSKVR